MGKFPFAESLKGEIEKLYDAVEDDAKEIITKDIPAVHAKRTALKTKVKAKVADAGSAVAEVDKLMDDLDEAISGSNSGERRPTFGDSSGSPGKPVDASKPSEAGLPKAGNINAPAATVGGSGGTANTEPFPGSKV